MGIRIAAFGAPQQHHHIVGRERAMQPVEIVREVSAAWGRRDLPALMKYVADDCVYSASVGPEPGETFVGRDAVRAGFAKLLAHDSDGVAEPGEMRSDGDWVVSTWGYRMRTPDGRQVLVRGCDLFVLRDGLIVRKDAFRKTSG
jgi:ketosteroid isomerase-like protein